MAGLLELARAHTPLRDDQIEHLQRLAASWGFLADLCFADLLLFAPLDPKGDEGFVVLRVLFAAVAGEEQRYVRVRRRIAQNDGRGHRDVIPVIPLPFAGCDQ